MHVALGNATLWCPSISSIQPRARSLLHTPNVSASPLEPSVVARLSTSPAGNPVLPMHIPAVLSSPAVCGHELFRLALAIPALDSVLSALLLLAAILGFSS